MKPLRTLLLCSALLLTGCAHVGAGVGVSGGSSGNVHVGGSVGVHFP